MDASTKIIAGGREGDFLTVRYARIAGTNREIGAELARLAREAHGAAAGPIPVGDPLVGQARRTWFRTNHPVLSERMDGVADEFGIDPDDPRFDMAWLGTYEIPAGCSAVAYPGSTTKSGHTLLARNFDFPTATFTQIVGMPPLADEQPLAQNPWVLELHPEGGYASITVGIMDVMGAMDGVNEKGSRSRCSRTTSRSIRNRAAAPRWACRSSRSSATCWRPVRR